MKTITPPEDDWPPLAPVEAYPVATQELARTSTFISAASLDGLDVPPRRWLVDGIIPSRTVTFVSGDGGIGKTLLMLQLACSTALGRPWLGQAVAGGAALFLTAEDDIDEIHRRLHDIARAEGVALAEMDRLTIRSLAGEDALLAHPNARSGVLTPSALFHELEAEIAATTPALVVLDPLADLFCGNENDRSQARQFVGHLRGLAQRHDCAVAQTLHPSLSGLNSGSGTAGTTGWRNATRSFLLVERVMDAGYEPDPDRRMLICKKNNYARVGGEIAMRWQDGVFVAEAQPTGLDAMAGGAKAERVFMNLLDAFTAQGRYVSASPGPTYGPSTFASHPDAEGCTKRALKGAMDTLFGRDVIEIAQHGMGAKARSHIARKGASHAKN